MNSNHSVEEIIQQAQSINPKKERWLSAALTRQRGDVNETTHKLMRNR